MLCTHKQLNMFLLTFLQQAHTRTSRPRCTNVAAPGAPRFTTLGSGVLCLQDSMNARHGADATGHRLALNILRLHLLMRPWATTHAVQCHFSQRCTMRGQCEHWRGREGQRGGARAHRPISYYFQDLRCQCSCDIVSFEKACIVRRQRA